jgi:hypothetical protein
MYDLQRVEVLNCLGYLLKYISGNSLSQIPTINDRIEQFSAHTCLHYKVDIPWVLIGLIHLDYIRMIALAKDLDLSRQSFWISDLVPR